MMRAWIPCAALAMAVVAGMPVASVASAASSATPSPVATPHATAPVATPRATEAPPTPAAKPTPPPTATRVAQPTVPAPAPTSVPTSVPTPKRVTQEAAVDATPVHQPAPPGSLRGVVFVDADGDGQRGDGEVGLADIAVSLTSPAATPRSSRTNAAGEFAFESIAPGRYHLAIDVPAGRVPTTGIEGDVEVDSGTPGSDVVFGLTASPDAAATEAEAKDESQTTPEPGADEASDEQIMALSSVSSLPLRFAEGRDLMAQVGRRALGDGLVWLGVPFRSQIDGSEFQYVNCGPASLTMVLAGFGLEVGPSQVRDYLNQLIDNYDSDLGTSLDILARIGKEAGLTPMDLYSDHGGYRNWSTDAVRWHVQQGHPVITLVKYRDLPGHGRSLSNWDHYIVVSGLTPNGFIYNDAAFATTLGYGLEISDAELEYAWESSSIPRHALALGLAPDGHALSFPEAPRSHSRPAAEREAAAARSLRRQAELDELEQPAVTFTPMPPAAVVPSAEAGEATTTATTTTTTTTTAIEEPLPAGPLIGVPDRWEDEVDPSPPPDGSPMGLALETSDQPTVEPRPGPGSVVPKLLVLVGAGWLLWSVWLTSAGLVRLRPSLAYVRAAMLGALGAFRSLL